MDETGSQAQLLHDDNEERITKLEEANGQPGSLENAFDALKMLVLLEHISFTMGVKDGALLDFEGRRAEMLTNIEKKLAEMQEARAAAERQQRLAGGPIGIRGGVPMRPGPGGIVRPS